AKNLGLEVIITDHHQVPEKTPPAYAVLNPAQKNCFYPYKDLSGVGVVFKLIIALRNKLRENPYFKYRLPNLKKHLDLVALGTIADLAPITGENRILAYHGLQEITNTQKPGLSALKKTAGCLNKGIDTADVGFLLGPRLNAAGRLETADSVVKLLISENKEEAEKIAKYLDEINRERQNIQKEIFSEAVELIESNPYLKEANTIVLASENWHPGVIGIVASKLISRYYRPTILIALDGEMGKASGRSIEGFNLYKSVKKCSHLLKKYGGHEMAVGFSIEKELIEEFKKYFEEESHKSIKDSKIFISPLKIDAMVSIDEISKNLYKELEMLAPFGLGNSRPVLAAKNVSLPVPPNVVGNNGDHLKMRIKGNRRVIEGIGFNMGNLISKFDFEVDRFDIAFTVSINRWNDKETLQLKLKDIRLTDDR
ncbi:MAG: single-stranded-DNA-specific exonuclease RecJ, partial [Nitrospinota bacterium]|nr:single-stranded-DNA-specific exonuclease RecJ [Nitrospinota bacterium]